MVSCPGDWEEVKLSDIGYTYSGLTGKTKADFETGNGKFITFLNVLNNIKIDIKILGRVSIRENERQNAVNVGDLFFNTSSETPEEVGMCAVLLDNPGICYLNSFCFGYRLKRTDISPLFLSYYFNSGVGREFMRIHAQGSTRYNLSKQSFLKQSIHIPTFKEQTAIADTLAAFDTHITNLTELITKKKAIRDGALDELMTGRTRFYSFCGDWEIVLLGSKCEITSSKRVFESEWEKSGIRFLRTRDIANFHAGSEQKDKLFISEETYRKKISVSGEVKKGDLLVTGVGTIGLPFIVETDEKLYFKDGNIIWVKQSKDINPKFLYYLFLSKNIQAQIANVCDFTTVGTFTIKNAKRITISLPPLDEQKAIADTLSALDKEISSLETERAKISSIRDGAMNDLLTGKVRLKIGI
ncbi:MAG: restriction endonuclease subunit S [Synergistaceae bacterium]|nr:restriction endonuclease subunit S [Synergistaceae bacterium]MBQ3759146.1 restriction endonuclease subunit S [Synergistaceae bacterium]MBR0168847.1 restriction endonuclease subunit S [Synergistaceae bacterium]MBR0186096.1 restriction endonuclease subunit S [Synergistaceae bacterium]